MALDLGDPWTGEVEIRNVDGELANADIVAALVTLPNGDIQELAAQNISTGIYVATFTPYIAGLHTVSWTASGLNASAYQGSFYVSDIQGLVDLQDAKEALRIRSNTSDERIRDLIRVATRRVERIVGQVLARRSVTETYAGGVSAISLRRTPVRSVTEVVEHGETLASTSYVLDANAGLLHRVGQAWWSEPSAVTVTYVVGPAVVDPVYFEAVLIYTQHLLDTSRGGSNLPRNAGGDTTDYDPAYPTVLRRISELVGDSVSPGMA